MTVALRDICRAIAKRGASVDPLTAVCEGLVFGVNAIKFAFYCYEDDETGVIAAVRKNVKIVLPPPDVQRKVVARLREQTRGSEIAEIDPEDALAVLPPAMRRKWKCHRCLSQRIAVEGRPVAVLAVFMDPDCVVTDRRRAWFALFGDIASNCITINRRLLRALSERDDEVRSCRELTFALDETRRRIREHLAELSKAEGEYRSGARSLHDTVRAIETSARTLYTLPTVDATVAGTGLPRDRVLDAWIVAGLADPRIKAFVGVRGSGKSELLHAVRGRVLASGVDESRIVTIDFEDARFRRFKTPGDVTDYLDAFPPSEKVNYLFLNEPGMFERHEELLFRLQANERWNVWVAASSFHAVSVPAGREYALDPLIHRTWADMKSPRARDVLARIWCQIFMRDISDAAVHPDIRAIEMLAGYYSDHLGEIKSLRDVSAELAASGRRLAKSSITAYRKALEDACLIELSVVYDVSIRMPVVPLAGRVFYTDLELRAWRFGAASKADSTRVALNRLYLELRRTYDKVYTPRDRSSDFVTLDEKGNPLMWNIPLDTFTDPGKLP